MKDLNPNPSKGYDNITAKLMQKYKNEIAHMLHEYINERFQAGNFPHELKIGCMIPIFKKCRKNLTQQIAGQSRNWAL